MFNAQLKTEKCKLKFVFYVDNVGRKVYVSCDSNLHIHQTYKHSCYIYTRPTWLVQANGHLLSLKSCNRTENALRRLLSYPLFHRFIKIELKQLSQRSSCMVNVCYFLYWLTLNTFTRICCHTKSVTIIKNILILSLLLWACLSLGICCIVYLFKSQYHTFKLCDTFTLPICYHTRCLHWSVLTSSPNYQQQLYVYISFIFLKMYILLSWFSESNVK